MQTEINNSLQSLTDFYESIFLLSVFHIGEVHLPAPHPFRLLAILLATDKLS